MKDWKSIKKRYLQDALPIRLGGLAANLARITSFSRTLSNYDVVESLLYESKMFIEWTAQEVEIETAATLVELQIQLAQWQDNLREMWNNNAQRTQVAEQSKRWSDRVLDMSGLLRDHHA